MDVLDLDVLRPAKKIVKLGGMDIDVSFMPLGLTFDIDDITRDMSALDSKKLDANDPEEVKKAFNLSIQLCVIFCQHQHPEMDRAWFDHNTSAAQVRELGNEIKDALQRAYEGINPKN